MIESLADARRREEPHGVAVEEWVFSCWGSGLGIVSGYRRFGAPPGRPEPNRWYWAALARAGAPLLHVADWEVPPRSDPLLVKGASLWAEHTCDAPMEQWTIANETYAAALDDPDEALGRAYGAPTAISWDLEWYATGAAIDMTIDGGEGYEQAGVVHGTVELATGPLELDEVAAHRWHRWGDRLGVIDVPAAFAHTGLRAPFAFPDGTILDWVLTPDGWRALRQGVG